MAIQVQTSLMVGGLDLATPPIALPPGKVIAATNYEPDVAGYTSAGGFERFDGRPRPSDLTDPAAIENRRNAIFAVPGVGPVRGVWVYSSSVFAFRDLDGTAAAMYRAGNGGWEVVSLGHNLQFSNGTTEFIPGTYIAGDTSNATALIERVVLRSGAWDGTAEGYLIVSNITGTFEPLGEPLTQGAGPLADGLPPQPVTIAAGGRYDFINHNFYGAADRPSMYFVTGTDTAFEWNGSALVPIFTGVSSGTVLSVTALLAPPQPPGFPDDFTILAADDSPIVMSALFDAPTYIAHFKNHLFLGFASGSVINSSLGEPLEYITTSGAGEISFGEPLTGLLTAASTSLMIFAQNRIGYLTGDDSTSFVMNPLSDSSGAQSYTAQMMDTPVYLDDAGVRALPTSAAFGDWRMATLTQPVERLIRLKRDTGIKAVASLRIKAKDQYKLFWEDGTGITVYVGRKYPETLPFKLPISIFCSCSGEVVSGQGDRLFVGCNDGFVYELNRGTSYDGADIQTYIRLPFTAAKSPMQDTRWTKATFEIDTPDDIEIGVAFDIDYARGLGGARVDTEVDGGTAIVSTDHYSEIDWTQPVEGRLEFHLSGIGPNIAATLITEASTKQQHTISSQTYNFSRRRLRR